MVLSIIKRAIRNLPVIIVAFFVSIFPGQSYGLSVTENSVPMGTVLLICNDQNKIGQFAASELQDYLQKISGATLPVVTKSATVTSKRLSCGLVILTGAQVQNQLENQSYINSLYLSLDKLISTIPDDGFVLKISGENILFAGSNDRGTLYSVYRFLEFIGVRFFAPRFCFYDGYAEVIPSKPSVTIDSMSIAEKPSYIYRAMDVGECYSQTAATLAAEVDWMAKNRMNLLSFPMDVSETQRLVGWEDFRAALIPEIQKRGIILEVGSHGTYDTFLPAGVYQSLSPDWFAQPSDPVVGSGRTPPANVFHITNLDALTTFIENGNHYLEDHPEIDILALWPPDGAKWPLSDINQLGTIPNAPAYVLNSFKRDLDKQVGISGLAYSTYTMPPDSSYTYDLETIMKFAFYDRSYSVPIYDSSASRNVYYTSLISTWKNAGFSGPVFIFEYYRKYYWHSLPICLIQTIGKEIPYHSSLSVKGLSHVAEPADWITYELVHWVLARLLWNSNASLYSYYQGYLTDRYGLQASDLFNYFTQVECAAQALFDRPQGNYTDLAAVTDARYHFLTAKTSLGHAKSTNSASVSFLVDKLSKNIDYAIADTEISYYALKGNSYRNKLSMLSAKQLLEENKFSGILLQNYYSIYRYDNTVTWNNLLPSTIQQYQNQFENKCE